MGNEMTSVADAGFIDEFKAECLAERFVRMARPLSEGKFVKDKARSSRRGAYIKYYDRAFAKKLTIKKDVSKKTYHCFTLEVDPERKNNFLLVEHMLGFHNDPYEMSRVISRVTFHFLVRLIQRTANYRKKNDLTMKEFKDVLVDVVESCNYYITAMIEKKIHPDDMPEETKYLLISDFEGISPIEFSPCPYGTTYENIPVPIINLKTFISLDKSSQKIKKAVYDFIDFVIPNRGENDKKFLNIIIDAFYQPAIAVIANEMRSEMDEGKTEMVFLPIIRASVIETLKINRDMQGYVDAFEHIVRSLKMIDEMDSILMSLENMGSNNPTNKEIFIEGVSFLIERQLFGQVQQAIEVNQISG